MNKFFEVFSMWFIAAWFLLGITIAPGEMFFIVRFEKTPPLVGGDESNPVSNQKNIFFKKLLTKLLSYNVDRETE